MPRSRIVMALVLAISVVLGIWAVRAIRSTAGRRAKLVDTLALRVPTIPDARVLTGWQPVADADLAHLTLCFDEADPATAVARFAAGLRGSAWRLSEALRPAPPPDRASITGEDGAYRLRALAEPGSRENCDGAKRQALLSVEAAPLPRSP